MTNTVSCEKKIHLAWKEIDDFNKKVSEEQLRKHIGKYQYVYSNDLSKISLVELPDYFHDGKTLFEIYQIKGEKELFSDVERFDTLEEAKTKCEEYLK